MQVADLMRRDVVTIEDSAPLHVMGNAQLFELVITNLTKNAIEAMKRVGKGTIHIRCEARADSIHVLFRDTGAGVPPQVVQNYVGIMKAYSTRVGGGPFPTEQDNDVGNYIRDRGHEYGTTTGRPRRCGWFDAAAMKRAVQLNGTSGLCITKLDVLDGLDVVRVATGYKVRGEKRDILPVGADALAICEPIYEDYPGWKESTVGVKASSSTSAASGAAAARTASVSAAVDCASRVPAWSSRSVSAGVRGARMSKISGGLPPNAARAASS